jgi:hypothetical protein
MKNDFVIVTSLYNLSDVKRDDGRDWQTYLDWFSKTLQIKCPFIIFTESNLTEFILNERKDNLTHIITEPLTEIPLYHLKDDIQEILDSDEYKDSMTNINRIECKDSIYSVIQYSKFKWIKKASEINPFNSKYFFWLDAGASRFIEDDQIAKEYPSKEAIEKLDGIDNTFLIQYNNEYYFDLVYSDKLTENYFFDDRSFICGSMFGGNAEAIKIIDKEIDDIMKFMISNNCINNEQIALGYLCKNKEEHFSLFYRNSPRNHLTLFQEMV